MYMYTRGCCYLGDVGDLRVVFDWRYQELCSGRQLDPLEGGIGQVVEDTEQHWRGDDLKNLVRKRSDDCIWPKRQQRYEHGIIIIIFR